MFAGKSSTSPFCCTCCLLPSRVSLTLPPSETIPPQPARLARATPGNLAFWGLYLAGLALMLAAAARLRFSLPQTPIIDPDFWGYLHPAVSALNGGPFQHTYGRNFVYPGFLYLLLRGCGDYRSICVGQHVLGLLTGVLLAAAWNLACGFLSAPRWVRLAAQFLGLILAADFLLTRSPLLFEHTVRPEAIFPCFLAGSFVLILLALRAGYVRRQPRLERWCLGLNFFVIYLAQSLKPSLGFGLVAANLPFACYLLRRGETMRLKALVAGAAVFVTALTLWLPERLLARSDAASATFLPVVLFVVHSRIIHAQIVDDLSTGQTAPYASDWLAAFNARLEAVLEVASHPDQSPYPTLGFNPDYLIYVDPVFRPAFRHLQSAEMAAFCMHYYRRTWLHRPGAMFTKVGTQLEQVYNFQITLGRKHRLRHLLALPGAESSQALSRDYRQAVVCCQRPGLRAKIAATRGGEAFLHDLETLADTPAAIRQGEWVDTLDRFLERWHLPLAIFTLLAGTLLLGAFGRRSLPLVAGVWLVWGINFTMFLTVAIVHSLEPRRYVENQRVCTVFGEFAALLLLLGGVTLLVSRSLDAWHRRTLAEPTSEFSGGQRYSGVRATGLNFSAAQRFMRKVILRWV